MNEHNDESSEESDEYDEYDGYDEDELFPVDLEQVFLQQMYRAMNITIGALIAYLGSDTFDDLDDDQRDYVFEYVIESWSMVLPPPLDDMWDKQIQLLALTQQIRTVAEQKEKRSEAFDKESRMKKIYSQLGWEYAPHTDDKGDKND
ncbi:MAG: hypothetical protein LC687_01350 [Actinobacteria bacterium]|nr:hypothetical protein [Actinomycetota bacterium]